MVEGHHVGVLNGFRFTPDATVEGTDAKASRAAAQKALAGEFDTRANRLGGSRQCRYRQRFRRRHPLERRAHRAAGRR